MVYIYNILFIVLIVKFLFYINFHLLLKTNNKTLILLIAILYSIYHIN
jgi:hypothetical protein